MNTVTNAEKRDKGRTPRARSRIHAPKTQKTLENTVAGGKSISSRKTPPAPFDFGDAIELDCDAFDFTDAPQLDAGTIDETKLANKNLRLTEGRRLVRRQERRRTANLDRVAQAAEQLGALPRKAESIHCVLRGTFALFDFIPAVIQLADAPVDALWIVTLGFSKANVEGLAHLVDAGKIKHLAIPCSHYFAAARIEGAVYGQAAALCAAHGFPIAAMRTHAKILLIAIGRRRLVIESSANLRSCHNVEQATVYDDDRLFEFHHDWIAELLAEATQPEA